MLADCSIVVVSHNSKAVLVECLQRLSTAYPQAELIVVDSGSSDSSPETVRAHYPNVQLLEVENRGYSHAVNRGLDVAKKPWLVQMNSDVYVEPGDLEALQAALVNNPKAAIAGPILVNQSGKKQSFGLFDWFFGKPKVPKEVSWVSGAIMMLRRQSYADFGGMDERFFFYNEDLEWCWRARRKGWRVLLIPKEVLHLGGSSTPRDPRFLAEGYRGGLLVSREYLPWLHGLHRKVLWLEAKLRIRLSPNTAESYRLVLRMLEGGLEGSPFRQHIQ